MVLFSQMKENVNDFVEKYGQENPPPPAQVFTVKNSPGDGNIQLVQKVFQGAFEVCSPLCRKGGGLPLLV